MINLFKPKEDSNILVDAIEDGKIVKVPEDYARREGLLVLRRPPIQVENKANKESQARKENKGFIGMEDLRKPLRYKENDVIKELVSNFHWLISSTRKARNLTRKQFSQAIGASELDIKMLENGVVPANNFILINKVEKHLGLNLRKNKSADAPSLDMSKIASRRTEYKLDRKETSKSEETSKEEPKSEDILGSDIEVYSDE